MADKIDESGLSRSEVLIQNQKKEKKILQGVGVSDVNQNENILRIKKAQLIPFKVNIAGPEKLKKFLFLNSTKFGCHEAYILFPLLSSCGGCLGPSTRVQLTPVWCEPPSLWTLMVSSSPSSDVHKSVIELMQMQMIEIQNEFQVHSDSLDNLTTKSSSINFVVEHFDRIGLRNIFLSNGGFAIGAYSHFEAFKLVLSKDPVLYSIFQKIFNGGPWASAEQTEQVYFTKTCVNLLGHSTIEELSKTFYEAGKFSEFIQDNFLIACPRDNCELKITKEKIIFEPSWDFKDVFKVIFLQHFNHIVTYQFSTLALERFQEFCENEASLNQKWANKGSDKFYQNRTKFLVRISFILHVINEALESLDESMTAEKPWNLEIPKWTLDEGINILNSIYETKATLMFNSPPTIVNLKPTGNINWKTRTLGIPASLSISVINGSDKNSSNPIPKKTGQNCRSLTVNKSFPPRSGTVKIINQSKKMDEKETTPSKKLKIGENFVTAEELKCVVHEDTIEVDWEEFYKNRDFFKLFLSRIAKLLTYKKSELTPSRICQLKMFPDPPTGSNTEVSGEKIRKYTVGFAKFALKRVSSYGFGELYNHIKQNNRALMFKKKEFKDLSPDCLEKLKLMRVSEELYSASFNIKSNSDSD